MRDHKKLPPLGAPSPELAAYMRSKKGAELREFVKSLYYGDQNFGKLRLSKVEKLKRKRLKRVVRPRRMRIHKGG